MAKRGRPPIDQRHRDTLVRLIRDDELPAADAARAVGVSLSAAYKVMAEAGESMPDMSARGLVMELGRAGLKSTRVARAAGVSGQRVRQIWAEEGFSHHDLLIEVDGHIVGDSAIGLGALRRALAKAARVKARKAEDAAALLGVSVEELDAITEVPEVCRG